MNFKFSIIFGTFLCLNLSQAVENASTPSDKAVIECGHVHHIEMHNFPNAIASYSNSKCALVCAIGNDSLPVETLNQGKSCPEDTSGICHNGHCIGGVDDALSVCSVEHSLDFHTMNDHQGTAFTNAQCMLRCVISGKEWSVNHMHEGSPCPANPNGVCRSGTCVTESTNTGSTVTPPQTTLTPIPPTTVTQSSIDSFSPSKMKMFNISLESSDPSLKQGQYIGLFYHKTKQSYYTYLCYFHPTSSNTYYYEEISDIPNKLNKASQIEIDLFESINHDYVPVTAQREDLYPLFATFYQNHKLAFGEKEDFVAKFGIHRKNGSHEKLMDVGLRFTIVFSKD